MAIVKTTLELPDDLVRAAKIRAANDGRKLKDVVADALRRGLAEPEEAGRPRKRVRLPLIDCAHDAPRRKEMTPERVAELLADDDATTSRGA